MIPETPAVGVPRAAPQSFLSLKDKNSLASAAVRSDLATFPQSLKSYAAFSGTAGSANENEASSAAISTN